MNDAPPTPFRSRLDPEPLPRRDFLGLAALASAGSALLFALGGILRLPKAAVLPQPSKKFTVRLPDSLPPGEPFIPSQRPVMVFRDKAGVYAISAICTHLGCVVRKDGDGLLCPCHGSRFGRDGSVERGPAPAALPWLAVTKTGEATYLVDEDRPVPAGTREPA